MIKIKFLIIFLNTLCMAFFYELILPSAQLSDGGLIGLAMIFSYVSKIELSYVYLFLNIPILVWLYKADKNLFHNSVFGMISFTLCVRFINFLNLTVDPPNAAIVIISSGFVLGFNFYALGKIRASFGGISPIAIKLDEAGIIKISRFYLITDVLVLFILLFLFGTQNFVLSVLFVFIQSLSIDLFKFLHKKVELYLKESADKLIKNFILNIYIIIFHFKNKLELSRMFLASIR